MSVKHIFLETMFDDFTPDSVSREELISILLDDLMVVARQRCFNPFADVWLEERVHRGAGDPPHRRAQVRSGCRGNGETRPFAKVIRLGDLFWRHIPVLWYNSPIHQSINRKE